MCGALEQFLLWKIQLELQKQTFTRKKVLFPLWTYNNPIWSFQDHQIAVSPKWLPCYPVHNYKQLLEWRELSSLKDGKGISPKIGYPWVSIESRASTESGLPLNLLPLTDTFAPHLPLGSHSPLSHLAAVKPILMSFVWAQAGDKSSGLVWKCEILSFGLLLTFVACFMAGNM